MKKCICILSFVCVAIVLGFVFYGKHIDFLAKNTVTIIEIIKDSEDFNSEIDDELLCSLMYKKTDTGHDTSAPGFISQLIYTNFGTYITGSSTSIPKEKQVLKDDVLSSISRFFIDYLIDPDVLTQGDEYVIEDLYQTGEKLIIKIKKITT